MSIAVICSLHGGSVSHGVFFENILHSLTVLSHDPETSNGSAAFGLVNFTVQIGAVCPVRTSNRSPVFNDHI